MLLDVFSGDAFGVVSLTAAINKMPFKQSKIGAMNLFATKGIKSTIAVIEEKDGILSLLPTAARGSPPNVARRGDRRARNFRVPHIPLDIAVMADEVQGVRRFGSESETEGVAQVVNDKIAEMRQSHEATLEYHRLGAVKGVVLDSDGTTVIHNLFTEFGITPHVAVEFDLSGSTPTIRSTCMSIKRTIEKALGNAPYDHIHCFCNSWFFDGLTGNAEIVTAYNRWLGGAALREDTRKGFEFMGIVFEEYRGGVGTLNFINLKANATIADGVAHFFPVGVPNMFVTSFAPADYIETVNTIGRPYYAKQERMQFDKGIMINTQSNPLCLCSRPLALIEGSAV